MSKILDALQKAQQLRSQSKEAAAKENPESAETQKAVAADVKALEEAFAKRRQLFSSSLEPGKGTEQIKLSTVSQSQERQEHEEQDRETQAEETPAETDQSAEKAETPEAPQKAQPEVEPAQAAKPETQAQATASEPQASDSAASESELTPVYSKAIEAIQQKLGDFHGQVVANRHSQQALRERLIDLRKAAEEIARQSAEAEEKLDGLQQQAKALIDKQNQTLTEIMGHLNRDLNEALMFDLTKVKQVPDNQTEENR